MKGSGGLLPCVRAVVSGVWGERTSERAKAVELWLGRERLSVRGSVDVGSPLSALGASGVGRYGFLGLEWGV